VDHAATGAALQAIVLRGTTLVHDTLAAPHVHTLALEDTSHLAASHPAAIAPRCHRPR
jgi:hypothetical protein